MTVIEKVKAIAQNTPWEACSNKNYITFEAFSPQDQNLIIEVEIKAAPVNEVLSNIYNQLNSFVDNFDVSSEAYLWLDNSGHGKNGAPHDMKDVYEDMEVYLEYAKELRDAFKKEG